MHSLLLLSCYNFFISRRKMHKLRQNESRTAISLQSTALSGRHIVVSLALQDVWHPIDSENETLTKQVLFKGSMEKYKDCWVRGRLAVRQRTNAKLKTLYKQNVRRFSLHEIMHEQINKNFSCKTVGVSFGLFLDFLLVSFSSNNAYLENRAIN